MSKNEFVTGLPIRRLGSTQTMELRGTIEDWEGHWTENGQAKFAHFKPDELERAPAINGA